MKRLFLLVPALLSCANQEAPASVKKPDAVVEAGAADAGQVEEAKLTTAKKYTVHFSPKGGCTAAIVAFIASAKTEVLVQAYSFTSKPIAAALVEKAKTVPVKVILDRDDKDTPGLKLLTDGRVTTWIDAKHQIAHNKVIVVDGKAVETGSFNYTQQAETGNAENCLVIHDAVLATEYADNWRVHLAHSTPILLDAGRDDGGR